MSNQRPINTVSKNHTAWLWSALLIGLYMSFATTINMFPIDADTANFPTLWIGIHQYGWTFLNHWFFTPDNWLFTLDFINYLIFIATGPDPKILIYEGFAIYAASAIFAALLVNQLLSDTVTKKNRKKITLAVACTLLFLGYFSHRYGFASYSVSHNSSNLIGLAGASLTISFLKHGRPGKLVALIAISTAAAVSDPWYLAAYTIPSISTIAIFSIFFKKNLKRNSTYLLFLNIFVLIAAKTKIFHLLSFLPSFSFSKGTLTSINENSIYVIKDLGAILNFFPWCNSNDIRHSLITIAIWSIFFITTIPFLRKNIQSGNPLGYHALFCIFSIAGVTLAASISNIHASSITSRFLINVPYLLIPLLAISFSLTWGSKTKIHRIFILFMACLFVLTGATTTQKYWARPISGLSINDHQIKSIARVLKQHGLRDGFGPYWGSQANAVSWLGGGLIVRPVAFDRVSGHLLPGTRAQSSDLWTLPTRTLAPTEKFIILASDGEECPDIKVCFLGVTQQFGAPQKVITLSATFDDLPADSPMLAWKILVWPYDILGYVNSQPYIVGEQIDFSKKTNQSIIWPGFGDPEDWGRWTVGPVAKLALTVSLDATKDYDLLLTAKAFSAIRKPSAVQVLINNEVKGLIEFADDKVHAFKLRFHLTPATTGVVQITLLIDSPLSPDKAGLSADRRPLGIGVSSMRIVDVKNNTMD